MECNYCNGDVLDRKNIFYKEYEVQVYMVNKNTLVIDNFVDDSIVTEINYCPMCGRDLNK